MPLLTTDTDIRSLLQHARTIAVVGMSDKPWRDSFEVASYLIEHGYTVIPVNPNVPAVKGLPAYPDISSIGQHVDIVDVFRRPEHLPRVVEDAARSHAGALWLQLGVVHEAAIARAVEHGLPVVVDRCIMVEHGRLLA